MMNDVSFIVVPAAAGFAVLAAVLRDMTNASAGLNARPVSSAQLCGMRCITKRTGR